MQDNKKKILILTSSLHIGGAERVIANLARYLDKKRFTVTVCHLLERGVIGDELEKSGIPIVGVRRHGGKLRQYLSFLELRKVVRQLDIDLVHSHTTYSLCDASLCRITVPGLKTVHTFHRGNYPNHDPKYMRLEKIFSRFASQLVAVGIEQKKKICSAYGLLPSQLRTILNGVENIQPTIDSEWEARLRQDGRVVIGSISTLIEQKGITDLLDVAQRVIHSGARPLFLIIGEGPLRAQLEEKARLLGIEDSVWFTGWVPSAATRVLPLFDIFVQSSLWEAMSMVVLEAMAASKPVVVTDVGDNRHVVEHGRTGYVVPAGDHEALAGAIQGLLQSVEARHNLGLAARARFEESYTAEAMARAHEDLYCQLLDK